MPRILALDIGGANIKVADGHDFARSWPFELWKTPEMLSSKIAECLAASPPHDQIAVTMTGELCDCYETKAEGVKSIVRATIEAAGKTSVLFYQTTGQLVPADEACENYLLTAASNWHALATFAARYCDGKPGLLIDIGSTTTDIIPMENGREAACGRTDPERLLSGELVYTGVERSPVCAILSELPWQGTYCTVAQEFFATSGDAYLLLGVLSEDRSNTNTADGMPFTYAAAHARMARMICADSELISREEIMLFSEAIRDKQADAIAHAFVKVAGTQKSKLQQVALSGSGEFLARKMLDRIGWHGSVISISQAIGRHVSRCAPAHALAVIAREKLQ